jgi:hypothetical protein
MNSSPIDLTNFEILGERIYVYKNFISESEINEVLSEVKNVEDEDLHVGEYFTNTMGTYNTRTVNYLKQRIQSLLDENHFAADHGHVAKMVKGNMWGAHSDVHDFEEVEKLAKQYKEGDKFINKQLSVFGTIVYYQLPISGGGLFYTKQNLKYMPSPGDLVVHGSDDYCEHGVEEVLDGERYSTSGYIYKNVKIKNEH